MKTLAKGQTVAGRYDLLAPIAEGGMGTVWRARDLRLGIDVALKLQRAPTADREETLARFAREADLSRRMLSRNVVQVIDRGIDESALPYIAYELLRGDELGVRLEREGRLSLALCGELVVQTCRALARAHAVGVLHMDIKPENIFLCNENGDDADARPLVKVLDFGIARMQARESGSSMRGEISGTLQYMSPEVLLDGHAPDARSDLYGLAVVAYECFTGRLPFKGETVGEMILEHTQTVPPPPSSLRTVRSDVATAIDGWFDRALKRDPAQRFQTAKEMAEGFVRVHRPKRDGSDSDAPGSVTPERRRMVSEYRMIREVGPPPKPSPDEEGRDD